MKEKILVVDDEPQILDLIEFILSGKGYQVIKAKDGEKALRSFSIHKPQLVLLDIKLPDRDGIGVLREMRRLNDEAVIIMISAHGTIQLAIESMKSGAYDFIEKPFETDQLQLKVRNALEKIRLEEEISVLKWELGEKYRLKNIIGSSDSMKEVFTLMKKVINNDITVLIRGESGTGKEMVARAIHFNGPRREEPFVAVNLGAIPENLMESELFGHEKGAFTGADYQRIGRFEQAKNGTIFLDEIADLTPSVQGKLLRVLQEKEVQRLGGKKDIPINARVIAATSKNLEQLLQEGHFREDLYFRINVFSINLPPLRERGEDIIELAEYFIRKKRKSTHHPRTESLRLGEDAKKAF
ncbi:TPA: sigma-54-dependent Fis family transcriptional regulator [Candidatus Bathyarchaeota archaeon]|nr:sigma-54-dependent Fis family transcriptional regulator [Candidatus Bathyarchaeota archaeon]